MSRITTSQDLLLHLAGRGDPSAFNTLVSRLALSTYVSVRHGGKTHAEAMMSLVPFLRKLHSAFLEKPAKESFDEWYEAQQKRLLPKDVRYGEDNESEAVLEAIPPSDVSHFESQMRLVFQRNYSARIHSQGGSFFGKIFSFVRFNVLVKTVLSLAAVVTVIAAGLIAALDLSKSTLTVTFSRAGAHRTIELPQAIIALEFWSREARNGPTGFRSAWGLPVDSSGFASAVRHVAVDSASAPVPPKRIVSERLSSKYAAPVAKAKQFTRAAPSAPSDSGAPPVGSHAGTIAPNNANSKISAPLDNTIGTHSASASRSSAAPDTASTGR